MLKQYRPDMKLLEPYDLQILNVDTFLPFEKWKSPNYDTSAGKKTYQLIQNGYFVSDIITHPENLTKELIDALHQIVEFDCILQLNPKTVIQGKDTYQEDDLYLYLDDTNTPGFDANLLNLDIMYHAYDGDTLVTSFVAHDLTPAVLHTIKSKYSFDRIVLEVGDSTSVVYCEDEEPTLYKTNVFNFYKAVENNMFEIKFIKPYSVFGDTLSHDIVNTNDDYVYFSGVLYTLSGVSVYSFHSEGCNILAKLMTNTVKQDLGIIPKDIQEA